MTINVYELVREGVFKEAFQTGSRYICNPPPMDTDDDYMCLVSSLDAAHRILTDKGCELGGSLSPVETSSDMTDLIFEADFSDFYSYRKGDVNIIITDNTVYFDRFKFATELAKRLNLLKKEDRITLFNGVMNEHIDGYYQPVRPIDWGVTQETPAVHRSNITQQESAAEMLERYLSTDNTVTTAGISVDRGQSVETTGQIVRTGTTGTLFNAGTLTWRLE